MMLQVLDDVVRDKETSANHYAAVAAELFDVTPDAMLLAITSRIRSCLSLPPGPLIAIILLLLSRLIEASVIVASLVPFPACCRGGYHC